MDPTFTIEPISVGVKVAVEITGLGERKIRELISTGRIPSALVEGRRLIFYHELKAFIRGENQ